MIDDGRTVNWSKASVDYGNYRPGPPDSFYEKLLALDIGKKGQHILDLGTGTGVLARRFAGQGAVVAGVDIAQGQIEVAMQLAEQEKLSIDFRISAAEHTPFSDQSFDAITANQCWLYFDFNKAVNEVKRLLKKEGILVISSFLWLPAQSEIVQASEKLILKYNPQWSDHSWDGNLQAEPAWVTEKFTLRHWLCYDEQIPFTRAEWRGRIRANRGIGATLTKEEVKKFEQEHDLLLQKIAGDKFKIPHRIFARVLMPK